NLEGWALVAEIGGAIAVIMSVIYLGRQINDNTKLLRSQAHYNALSLAQRPLEMMVENERLAGAVIPCDANPNGVAAATWERCATTISCSSTPGITCTTRIATVQFRNSFGLEQMPISR